MHVVNRVYIRIIMERHSQYKILCSIFVPLSVYTCRNPQEETLYMLEGYFLYYAGPDVVHVMVCLYCVCVRSAFVYIVCVGVSFELMFSQTHSCTP